MRDLLLSAIVFGSIPFILRKPYIGVLMFVWLSVMNPHRLTWGFSRGFGFAALIAAVTLVSALVSKDLKRPPINALSVSLLLFVAWTGVTTVFALYPEESYEKWTILMKTQLMAFLIIMLIHRKEEVRQLIWVLVLSIAYFGTKGGFFTLITGGQHRVWGPEGTYLEDNNYLAAIIVTMIPLMRYLQLTSPHRNVRWGLTAMMLLCGVSVLGSYSRGALVAVSAMVAFLWWKSRHKSLFLVAGVLIIPLALSFMPERWYQRMDTITNYEEESSAQLRLNSWATMFNLAKDRPLVGGGFEVATREIYERYSPNPRFPPQVAHSIYFQAMGEHGFVGLGLYMLVLFTFWRHAGTLVRLTRERADLGWARDFGVMMQVCIVGYAVGGAFLSLINVDVSYYLIAAILVIRALVDQDLRAEMNAPMLPASPISFSGIQPQPSPKTGHD